MNWKGSKIALKIIADVVNKGATKKIKVNLPLFNNFKSATIQNFDKIHGAGPKEFNAGVVRKAPAYNFTITTYANSGKLKDTTNTSTARLLRALEISRNAFEIEVAEKELLSTTITSGASFQLAIERFSKCYVVTTEVSYTPENVPLVTYTCVAYRHAYDVIDEKGVYKIWDNDSFGDGRIEIGLQTVVDGENKALSVIFSENYAKNPWSDF